MILSLMLPMYFMTFDATCRRTAAAIIRHPLQGCNLVVVLVVSNPALNLSICLELVYLLN